MNPQVSILVPVYNTSKYIERCVRSLFDQTYDNIEYIFVNDCTPDDSMEILAKVLGDYQQRESQVRIINFPENRGIAAGRNRLISEINGKYAIFVDSDDYIEKNTIELLVNEALRTNAEIVAHDFVEEYENGRKKVVKIGISDQKEGNVKSYVIGVVRYAFLWGKLIDSKLFTHPHFKPLPAWMDYHEDHCLVVQLSVLAKNIAKINEPLYHYIKYNGTSITSFYGKSSEYFEYEILRWDFIENFLKETNYYERNKNDIDCLKIAIKANLMRHASSIALRKKYANLWYDEETKYYRKLKQNQRIIIFFVRHRLFVLTQLFHHVVSLLYKIFHFLTKKI